MHNSLALFERLSILYAEDEESLRRSVCQTLEIFFDKVIEAKDGEEALELFFEHKPDILLLDICMPKCDGLKLLKEIRKSHKRVPVIIMSAYAEPAYFQQSIELNICKYLLKPFSKESFLDALKTCARWMYEWGEGGLIRVGNDLFYDPISGMLLKEKEQFLLTKKERLLFEYLLRQKNRVISFEELEEAIWAEEGGSKEALKALVKELRKKLDKESIENVFGIGYKLAIR
ncbi:response regulator transcription factor [Sulfurospirillum oryzae]|uniref:response regulator transcription factor n=1 Tax=Sulfurospirillum oryzae TaxID=2976535 RepID=UPI0021E8D2B7|nr:response regulator transcription factor [Sulfurospirillum oryzae]